MKIFMRPTSLMLVGFLFICVFSVPALAGQPVNNKDLVDKFKDFSSDLRHQKNSDIGMLTIGNDTIYFPWASRQTKTTRTALTGTFPASPPRKDEIEMDCSNSDVMVRDMSAINSIKERDVLYANSNSQNGDPKYKGLVNSLGISVSGEAKGDSDKPTADRVLDLFPQEGVRADHGFGNDEISHPGNYLNIDVRDISVSAINTMEGGSAVATSNIIIEPVQIIGYPSEVDAKLR